MAGASFLSCSANQTQAQKGLHAPLLSILLIENDEDDQFIFASILEELPGLKVELTWARTLAEANSAFAKKHYDLVFIDLHLDHGEAGHTFLRDHPQTGIPMLMLTAHGTIDDDHLAMKLGADNFLDKEDFDEQNVTRLIRHALARAERNRNLQEASERDALTGLHNRRALQRWFDGASARTIRNGGFLAVVAIDLDEFKPINDSFGHAAGDQVLCVIAKRLLTAVRSSDLVARVGGDEFLLLLEDTANEKMLQMICKRTLKIMQKPIRLPMQQHEKETGFVSINASLGAVVCRENECLEALLKRADQAMYVQKASQRLKKQF